MMNLSLSPSKTVLMSSISTGLIAFCGTNSGFLCRGKALNGLDFNIFSAAMINWNPLGLPKGRIKHDS